MLVLLFRSRDDFLEEGEYVTRRSFGAAATVSVFSLVVSCFCSIPLPLYFRVKRQSLVGNQISNEKHLQRSLKNNITIGGWVRLLTKVLLNACMLVFRSSCLFIIRIRFICGRTRKAFIELNGVSRLSLLGNLPAHSWPLSIDCHE